MDLAVLRDLSSFQQNTVCKEDQTEESSQTEKIWSIPSLIDYLTSASDSVSITQVRLYVHEY